MQENTIEIPFPLGGASTRRGYQESDPQTTRYSSNVTPDDSLESRTRGGSRPGLTKRYNSQLDGTPIYMVRVSSGESTRVYEYLVVGTTTNIYVGKSIPSGVTVPITYSEVLNPITGDLLAESGLTIITEASVDIIVDDFSLNSIDRNQVVSYRGNVILGAEDAVLTTSATGAVSTSSLDDAAVANWTLLGIDVETHVVDIVSSNVTINDGTYKIASVASGSITLASNPLNTGSGPITATYTIRTGVRVLNPETPDLSLLTPTGGIIPTGADAVAVFRDRIVWGIARVWYMSAQGDAGNYDYAADPEDPTRAVNGAASDAGQPADPIVAMASSGFDYLIIFAENSTWVMKGDPAYQGQLYNLSTTLGCVAGRAWCYGDGTEIYFLAKDGLCVVAPNAGGIKQLSSEQLPRDLRGVDRDNFNVTLAYDPDDGGVLIFVVPKNGGTGSHWWFDVDTESFWAINLADNAHQPVEAVTFGGSPTRVRRVILAGMDGYLREWTGTNDDGTTITSYLVLGPYRIGNGDLDGIVSELNSVLDESAGNVTVRVYVGDSSEEAVEAAIAGGSTQFSVTVSGGRSFTLRPRLRGTAFCVRLDSTETWAFEGMSAMMKVLGKRRL